MENVKVASKFVVQYARLLEVDRGGAPHFGSPQILAVAESLAEARAYASRVLVGGADVQILEVFSPVSVGGVGLKFLSPEVHSAEEPKAPKAKKSLRRKAA